MTSYNLLAYYIRTRLGGVNRLFRKIAIFSFLIGAHCLWQLTVYASPAGPRSAIVTPSPVLTGGGGYVKPMLSLGEKEAFRLLSQGSFGATESELGRVSQITVEQWLAEQFSAPVSSYPGRDRDQVAKWSNSWGYDFCRSFTVGSHEHFHCYDQYFSSSPIRRAFFKNAVTGVDQLRQRIAFALSQILVISEAELIGAGTYGFADYNQMLLDKSFGTYGELLRAVTLHPMMGRYLTLVHSEKSSPNENYARELLQLFSIGLCELNSDGSLQGGVCVPTYDNQTVREYAFALTGYTYPAGGTYSGQMFGLNPGYMKGQMVVIESRRDTNPRNLLSGVQLAGGSSATQALDKVIQSIEQHPSYAPFVVKQLIKFLVTSNPSPAYVQRAVQAFRSGRYGPFGKGQVGDLQATTAAILMDSEARSVDSSTTAGKLREPINLYIALVRALGGITDGESFGVTWQSTGSTLNQPFMFSPSVFNYYMPDYQIPGANGVVAPQFQLITPNSTIGWFNTLDDLIYGGYNNGRGIPAASNVPDATGTKLNFGLFANDATSNEQLIARLDRILTGGTTSASLRAQINEKISQISLKQKRSESELEKTRLAVFFLAAKSGFIIQK
jgi:hypothetical protein